MDKMKINKPVASGTTARSSPRMRAVPAVSRTIAILRLLGWQNEPTGVKAIAGSLDMVTSTALHILRVLVDEGLVRVDPATKRYTLGTGLLSLARSVLKANTFIALAQPSLDQIADKWGLSLAGVEIMGSDMLVVALSRLRTPYRLHIDIGARFPALAGSTGRLVAALNELPPAELRKCFNELKWHEPPTFNDWRKEVDLARTKGYSLDPGNDVQGVYNLAVPVLDMRGHITHSLVAGMVGDQLSRMQLRELVRDMMDEAQAIAAALHGVVGGDESGAARTSPRSVKGRAQKQVATRPEKSSAPDLRRGN